MHRITQRHLAACLLLPTALALLPGRASSAAEEEPAPAAAIPDLPVEDATPSVEAAVQAVAETAAVVEPQTANGELDEVAEVIVFARSESQLGRADAASEGAVGGADLSVRPLLRVAELLEAVPGLIAAQHSGTGKANQYFLRGFNLDHGTDFTVHVDGTPWNLRTHGHGQGYLDVNGLIPEAVNRIDYRKGTYRADVGDFSMAGSSFISTVDRFDEPFVSSEVGEFGWARLAAGGSRALGEGALTGIAQWKTYDGPWQLGENLHHGSLWTKYLQPTALGKLAFTLSGYHASWNPTEQIPERVIGTAVCAGAFCALDRSATGRTDRWIATAQLVAEDWQASGYAQHYDWRMLSNATYDYQIEQFDRRNTLGGRIERRLLERDTLKIKLGSEARHDDIAKVGLDHTVEGTFVENIGNNAVRETSAAIFSEASWTALERLRLFVGLRGDLYAFDVRDRTGGNSVGPRISGEETDTRLSPKLGAAYALTEQVELYANWGRGFHSNDARGVVNAEAPVAGLVRGTGYEGGARWEVGALKLSATYWWLNLDSELKFVGDSNSVEPGAASKRRGYELVGFWKPQPWLGIDAVYTGSRARADIDDAADHLTGAIEHAGELGVSAMKNGWEASSRLRYLGPYPLLEDNSERTDGEVLLNLRLAWNPGPWTLYGELLNVLDHDGKDIVYWYGTNVPGIDPTPDANDLDSTRIEGRVSRAEEPRTLRVGLKYAF